MVPGGDRGGYPGAQQEDWRNHSIFRPAGDNLTEEADVSLNIQNASDIMY